MRGVFLVLALSLGGCYSETEPWRPRDVCIVVAESFCDRCGYRQGTCYKNLHGECTQTIQGLQGSEPVLACLDAIETSEFVCELPAECRSLLGR